MRKIISKPRIKKRPSYVGCALAHAVMLEMIKYKIDFNNITSESPFAGVQYKRYADGDKQIRLIEYTKEMPLHWCEKGHWGMVLDGQMEIEFPSGKVIYKKGDGIFIPDGPEHKHRGRVLTESAKVVFVENA